MSLTEMFKLLEMFITRVSGKIGKIEWSNESQTKNPSISLKPQCFSSVNLSPRTSLAVLTLLVQ